MQVQIQSINDHVALVKLQNEDQLHQGPCKHIQKQGLKATKVMF
jgi:hypothetical protein